MKTILVCNPKGGVGKTLLADEITFALERDGFIVNFFDLDGQGGCLHTSSKHENATIQVVDTPGYLSDQYPALLDDADFVLIPTRMTFRDQPALQDIIRMMDSRKTKKPVLYVMNGWNRFLNCKEFEEWFASAYPDCRFCVLSQSESFNHAAMYNQSVVEYKKNSEPATQIENIYSIIKYELGLDSEKHHKKKG